MDNCFCIKGVYDFVLKVIDTKTILYTDLTQWMLDAPYVLPDQYRVALTLPDSSVISFYAKALNNTILKASELGIPKFKDGIYCFTIDPLDEESGGCGIKYTKSYGVFPSIECCLDKAYSTLSDDKYDDIKDVEKHLEMATFSSEIGMEKESEKQWVIAKKLLDKLNCNCSC